MRTVRVRNINERALLIDLIEQGAVEDASLPSPELLASWISGASLRRPRQRVERSADWLSWMQGMVGAIPEPLASPEFTNRTWFWRSPSV